jgi:hypothetical protein
MFNEKLIFVHTFFILSDSTYLSRMIKLSNVLLNFKLFRYDICFRYKNELQKEDKDNLKFLLSTGKANT